MSVGRKIAGSILTRPVGRVQLTQIEVLRALKFQSSPGPWAECNARSVLSAPGVGRVQLVSVSFVSILTRPVGRVQRRSASSLAM